MLGTINAVNDTEGGKGAGIYVNGNIKHEDNSPIINLSKTSKITSTGNGIYAAGYATYNINGAYISGSESGLGIKSGVFNINDGTIIGTGTDETPTSGNNNGINPSGTAIQIESNNNYKGNIKLNIKNGLIQSNNSYVIYEYTVNNTSTKVSEINLSGGTYNSIANKEVFSLSNSFKTTHPQFITGGTYSSNPSNYLKSGYSTSFNNQDEYEVISVFKELKPNNELKQEKKSNLLPLILIITIITLPIIFFLSKQKIFTNKK